MTPVWKSQKPRVLAEVLAAERAQGGRHDALGRVGGQVAPADLRPRRGVVDRQRAEVEDGLDRVVVGGAGHVRGLLERPAQLPVRRRSAPVTIVGTPSTRVMPPVWPAARRASSRTREATPAARGVEKLVPPTSSSVPASQAWQYGMSCVKSETKSGKRPASVVWPLEEPSSKPETPMLHHGPAPARSGVRPGPLPPELKCSLPCSTTPS